jgi:hypothetical protein
MVETFNVLFDALVVRDFVIFFEFSAVGSFKELRKPLTRMDVLVYLHQNLFGHLGLLNLRQLLLNF